VLEGVQLMVFEGVAVCDTVKLGVLDRVEVNDAVADGDAVFVGVLDRDQVAVAVRVKVGDAVGEAVALGVEDGDGVGVIERVAVAVFVRVGLLVKVRVGVIVAVNVGVRVQVKVGVDVAVTGHVGVATGPFDSRRTSSMAKLKAPVARAPHCRSVTRVTSNGCAGLPQPRCVICENSTVTPAHEVPAVNVTPWWSPVVTEALGTWNQ